MIIAATGKEPDEILEDDILEIITGLGMAPRILYPNGFKRMNRFAFVIHPLSQEYFKKVKPVDLLSRVSPPLLMNSLEKVMAYAPPFVYSQGRGHQVAHRCGGRRLADLGRRHAARDHEPQPGVHLPPAAGRCRHGQSLGAQIMGLGAFTKVVGDAGATVAKRASCPSPPATATAHRARCGRRTMRCCACACCRGRKARRASSSRPWWWALPAPSAPACARLLVRPPKRSPWSRPRPPSCWR
jgi:hypothetical protein